MIRWQRVGDGEWSMETARGQFVGGDSHIWRVRLYSASSSSTTWRSGRPSSEGRPEREGTRPQEAQSTLACRSGNGIAAPKYSSV